MKRPLLALALSIAACGHGAGQDLGNRVQYMITEPPVTSGYAGSCLPNFTRNDYVNIQDLTWGVGASVSVQIDWPDRKDCHRERILGPRFCDNVELTLQPINSIWTKETMSSNPAPAFITDLRATAAGDGGMRTIVHGKEFDPSLVLKVVPYASIRFEQARGALYSDLIPGATTEIHLPQSSDAIVVGTLRDAAGQHVCGALAATATISPPGIFGVQTVQGPYINLPYIIYSGDKPGRGAFEVQVGDIKASLTVIVDKLPAHAPDSR